MEQLNSSDVGMIVGRYDMMCPSSEGWDAGRLCSVCSRGKMRTPPYQPTTSSVLQLTLFNRKWSPGIKTVKTVYLLYQDKRPGIVEGTVCQPGYPVA